MKELLINVEWTLGFIKVSDFLIDHYNSFIKIFTNLYF